MKSSDDPVALTVDPKGSHSASIVELLRKQGRPGAADHVASMAASISMLSNLVDERDAKLTAIRECCVNAGSDIFVDALLGILDGDSDHQGDGQ